jgi:hypothetical protein
MIDVDTQFVPYHQVLTTKLTAISLANRDLGYIRLYLIIKLTTNYVAGWYNLTTEHQLLSQVVRSLV